MLLTTVTNRRQRRRRRSITKIIGTMVISLAIVTRSVLSSSSSSLCFIGSRHIGGGGGGGERTKSIPSRRTISTFPHLKKIPSSSSSVVVMPHHYQSSTLLSLMLNHHCAGSLPFLKQRTTRGHRHHRHSHHNDKTSLRQSPITTLRHSSSQHHSSSSSPTNPSSSSSPKKIAIIGGGLAGLSVSYHLLLSSSSSTTTPYNITIYDPSPQPHVGTGASHVAGGLLHPFSPSGKLAYMGREGLACVLEMIAAAAAAAAAADDDVTTIRRRDCLYRVLSSEKDEWKWKETARLYPEWVTWKSAKEMKDILSFDDDDDDDDDCCGYYGGVMLSNGCGVIDVPSYLQGLYEACKQFDSSSNGGSSIRWKEQRLSGRGYNDEIFRREGYDVIILTAGAGLWTDGLLPATTGENDDGDDYPVQLVRGQSLIFDIPSSVVSSSSLSEETLLCGKYVIPLSTTTTSSSRRQVLIGATHEFGIPSSSSSPPHPLATVASDLKKRTYHLSPSTWDYGIISHVTEGIRVQPQRHALGRLPLVGRLPNNNNEEDSSTSSNIWMLTGLGSRGLLYHGIYGKILAEAIGMGVGNNDDEGGEEWLWENYPSTRWFRDVMLKKKTR